VRAMASGLLVVIPAYNEAATLGALVAEIRATVANATIVVVDDGSTDRTRELLPTLRVRWLTFPQRAGAGAAVRAGLRYGAELGLETAVRLDGDGQHPPSDIPRLLAPIASGRADAVQGSRYAATGGYRAVGARRAGQRMLGVAMSVLTGRRVSDPTSGFWAFGPRASRLLARQHPSGYPEAELLLLLHAHRLRVTDVSVVMRPRVAGHTSLTGVRLAAMLARAALTTVLAPLRPIARGSAP
jgi:glycosyltransferase involved in cell wall biosynthesis